MKAYAIGRSRAEELVGQKLSFKKAVVVEGVEVAYQCDDFVVYSQKNAPKMPPNMSLFLFNTKDSKRIFQKAKLYASLLGNKNLKVRL